MPKRASPRLTATAPAAPASASASLFAAASSAATSPCSILVRVDPRPYSLMLCLMGIFRLMAFAIDCASLIPFHSFSNITFHSLTHLCRAVVVKKGAAELPGITDDAKPRRLGPKRATSIRKLFNLKNVGALRGVASVPNHILIFYYDALCLQ